MEFTHKTLGNIEIVSPKGRIDQFSAESFQASLAPYLANCLKDGAALVLDFSEIDYISSLGLRVLMLAARQVKAQNGRIAVAALQPIVEEVFKITRFHLVFNIFDSVSLACESLA
jgi:anti-sigma B factor antagonist